MVPDDLRRADESLATGDVDGAVAHLSAAVIGLTAEGDRRQAAMASARLGDVYANMLGNRVAARPWFLRAMRLVEDEPPCVEQGYVALAAMGCDVDDPEMLIERAELALDRARRFGDVDLEVKALADGGLAHVQAGRVATGMAMVDEAMSLACGAGTSDEGVIGKSVCSFFTACYFTADFERVEAWGRVLRERGLIGAAPGAQAFLRSHCDSVRGTLLCHLGQWSAAEDVLTRALDDLEAVMPGMAWHPPIALAELRILQGRLSEAEALLLGRDDHIQALLPMARLHLARHDYELAKATARRGLRLMVDDRVRAAALLGVLVEAELGCGDIDGAAEAAAELDTRTRGVGLPVLSADAARIRARLRTAQGHEQEAIVALQEGLDELAGVDLPLLRCTLHLELSRRHEAAGDLATAVVEGRAAGALLARLDVVVPADDAALLRRLGIEAAALPTTVGCRLATLERQGDWWTAGCGGTAVRVRSTKGLRYLAELVVHPGVERHALDLVDLVEGLAEPESGVDRRRLGDAGAMLDAQSRAAYRRRVSELRDDVEDALDAGDDVWASTAQAQLDALVSELARAFGIGGRERVASSATERARLNVTRALRAALTKLTEALPEAGAALDRRIVTGVFCSYQPQAEDEVTWSVTAQMFSPH